MPIITIGIDLAKNIFAVHGVNENGQPALVKPKISRDQHRVCVFSGLRKHSWRRAHGTQSCLAPLNFIAA